jgi:DNA-binding beta-propeller fold protein YncE
LYAVNSDGVVYEVKDFKKSGKSNAVKFSTPFTGKNNIESLAYDPQKNRLLIAPKDKGLDNDKDREIYELDLKTRKLNNTPVYSISLKQIEDYFKGDALEESSKKFLKVIGNKNLNEVFRPSALGIHPVSHEIYVLSSINNLVAVLAPTGTLRKIIELQGPEFLQPEGLAFAPNGQLYISNEGKGGKANIIRLNL